MEHSVALITNVRRSGTTVHYESAWRKWHSWCSQKEGDPIKCSVNKILQFLTECFNLGFEDSTIARFRSAISAYNWQRIADIRSFGRIYLHIWDVTYVCVSGGKKCSGFLENLACFVFLKHPF